MERTIIAKNITKKYKLYNDTKERLFDLVSKKEYGEDFYALANVNFEAEKGEVIGFVGVNGSGKSTLSNVLAGIVPETTGTVKINGKVSLIAVAAGLKSDLSGRDNIELKLLMLGFNKKEIKILEPEIIEFSELGKFIEQPVKSYSSGMKSRLGFAISVSVNPDILIIDEALSVGDKAFAEKSLKKMNEFKEQGKTMIFVSHSIGQMKKFCESILWLEFGMIREYGSVEEVIPKYERFLNKWQKYSKKEREIYRSNALRFQQKILDYPDDIFTIPDSFIEEEKEMFNEYKIVPVSRIGQIKTGQNFIYKDFKNLSNRILANEFRNQAYYIKRQVNYEGIVYYLLSVKPSGENGVIGWIKKDDITSYEHVAIDQDRKQLQFKGTGIAYDTIWGGKRNRVYSNLSIFKGQSFQIMQTDKVGRNIWYQGEINKKKVWVHASHLSKKN